jgi:large subunit ribosomal protein L18
MAKKNVVKHRRSEKRRRRVRSRVFGTPECPRLTVAKSLTNIYAQIIDDEREVTVVAVSSLTPSVVAELKEGMKKTEVAKRVGEAIARAAKEKGVAQVVFDRNENRYHGRIKALAEGARAGGLQF